jgi:hypothetical protein
MGVAMKAVGLLGGVADLVDRGVLYTTVTQKLSPINAANLKQLHKIVESGRAIGKVTLAGSERDPSLCNFFFASGNDGI